jgi:uncharacterized membrane protein (UPF0136 family)
MTTPMLDAVRIYLYVFGVLTIAGGIMGYVKANSRPSLIAGVSSGVLLIGAAYLVGAKGMIGLLLGLIVSLPLAGRFISGFRKTGKVMPAGVMALLSVGGVVLSIAALLGAR